MSFFLEKNSLYIATSATRFHEPQYCPFKLRLAVFEFQIVANQRGHQYRSTNPRPMLGDLLTNFLVCLADVEFATRSNHTIHNISSLTISETFVSPIDVIILKHGPLDGCGTGHIVATSMVALQQF